MARLALSDGAKKEVPCIEEADEGGGRCFGFSGFSNVFFLVKIFLKKRFERFSNVFFVFNVFFSKVIQRLWGVF